MLYITIKKNLNYKYSYIIILMNNKRRVLKKLGTFSFNTKLNKFIFHVDLLLLLYYLKNGISFNLDFYKILYKYINNFIL